MYGVLIGKTVRQERRIVNWRNAPVLPENFAMTVRISLYTNVLATCAWKCLLSDWIRTAKKGAWPSWRKCLCTVPQDRRLHRRMDQPNMCKCPGTATYPTLHAGEQWISRVAPIETCESLPPMKLHNVEARTPGSSAYQLLPESGYWSSQTQRAGDLLTCFELFQRHLTNLPRFYKVVQDDCIWLQIHTKMPRCKMSQRRPQNKNEYTHAHQKMD